MTFSKPAMILGLALLAGCATAETGLDGSYRLVSIDGRAVIDNPTLVIEGQRLSGKGSCNSFSGENKAAWPALDASPLATTRRACINDNGETAYFRALDQATLATLTEHGVDLTGPEHSLRFTRE